MYQYGAASVSDGRRSVTLDWSALASHIKLVTSYTQRVLRSRLEQAFCTKIVVVGTSVGIEKVCVAVRRLRDVIICISIFGKGAINHVRVSETQFRSLRYPCSIVNVCSASLSYLTIIQNDQENHS